MLDYFFLCVLYWNKTVFEQEIPVRGIFILVLVLSRKRKIEVFSCFYELLILKISPVTILKDHTTAI
jgi:hypothetical protein